MTVVEEPLCVNLSLCWYSLYQATKPKGNKMPNWCYNYMTVMGNNRDITKFVNDITTATAHSAGIYPRVSVEYDLNKLVPLDPRANIVRTSTTTNDKGEEVTTTYSVFADKARDGFDGYLDALETWGSKWGACRVEIDDPTPVANTVSIRYESAWSPADALVCKISALYPNLVFGVSTEEESRAFIIWTVFHNGENIEDGQRDPNYLTPELRVLSDKAEAEDADDSALEEWWEAHAEWNNYLRELCDNDMLTCMREYRKHLAYVRRCRKEGRMERTFISSV